MLKRVCENSLFMLKGWLGIGVQHCDFIKGCGTTKLRLKPIEVKVQCNNLNIFHRQDVCWKYVYYVGYHWLGVFKCHRVPSFDGVKCNSRLLFKVLLAVVWSNLLFGTFPVSINSVLKRSPCLINEAHAASTRPAGQFWGHVCKCLSHPSLLRPIKKKHTCMLGLVGRIGRQLYSRGCYAIHRSQTRATLLRKQEQTVGRYNKHSTCRILVRNPYAPVYRLCYIQFHWMWAALKLTRFKMFLHSVKKNWPLIANYTTDKRCLAVRTWWLKKVDTSRKYASIFYAFK